MVLDNSAGSDRLRHQKATQTAQVTGDGVLDRADQSAAVNYGKGTVGAHFPSNKDLLDQIKEDEAKKVYTPGRESFAKEREVAENLKPEELRNIGAIVDAIQNKKFDHQKDGPNDSLQDALKPYAHDPRGLERLKDMIQLEMERRKLPDGKSLADQYQVEIVPYSTPGSPIPKHPERMNRSAFIVSTKGEDQQFYGYSNNGSKLSRQFLNSLGD